MEAPGFRVPIVVSDNPHQAMELFDSKLSNNSILLSLYKKMKELSLYSHNNSVYFCTVIGTYDVFIIWHVQLTGSSR